MYLQYGHGKCPTQLRENSRDGTTENAAPDKIAGWKMEDHIIDMHTHILFHPTQQNRAKQCILMQ